MNKTSVLLLFLIGLLFNSSCSDIEPIIPNPAEEVEEIGYDLIITTSSKEEILILPGYCSPLDVTLSDRTWLSFDEVESDNPEENAKVKFRLTDVEDGESKKQVVNITDANGRKCKVSISTTLSATNGDNGADEEFLTDWENQKEVQIFSNNATMTVATPWNESTTIGSLPQAIRSDVKKEDGWEMVFSTLNQSNLNNANYFALYNKNSGVLRIFYYVADATTTSSNFCLEVDMGSKSKSNKYPFYHSLQFGIPSNHNSINNAVDLLGLGNVATTFKTFVTPHTTSSSSALSQGWTAFDLDASAYCPSNNEWMKSNDEMSFSFRTSTESLITLCGSFTGNIDGNFSKEAETSASASSGIGKSIRQIGNYAAQASKPLGFLTKLLWGKDVSSQVNTLAGIINFTGSIADKFGTEVYEEKYVDDMAGKIEMSLTGQLNLSGKISTPASNNCPPLIVNTSYLRDSHFGEGIWGLADDPVVYLVSDVVIGDSKTLTLVSKGNGKFQMAKDAAKLLNLRMVTFLDPTSIKLALNEKLLQNISDVEVLGANIGVYPNENAGITSPYRTLLNLPAPTLSISSQTSGVWKGLHWNKAKDCGYMQIPCTSLIASSLGETSSNCGVYAQRGADYKYYGMVDTISGKSFIVDPQVMLPCSETTDGAYLTNGIVPDFVVTVTIRFKANNRFYVFSRRFIPKIETVSIKNGDLTKVYNRLVDFNTKCLNKQSINTVNGHPVKHRTGESSVERPLCVLRKLLGK